jgi:signal transduction histidine kinase
VVSNLLENELTHLPARCRVSVRLHSHQGSAELVIEDDGPGFPPDIGSRAFERFVKGTHSRGHGLGLAFVDAIAQAHGGSARISDRSGGAAVITLSPPLTVLRQHKPYTRGERAGESEARRRALKAPETKTP